MPTTRNGPHSLNLPTRPEGYAKDMGNTAAANMGEGADGAASLGAKMQSMGSSLREHSPGSGFLRDASHVMADTLESSGRYLQDQGLQGMCEDVTNLIRRNPVPALLMGVGLGFLVARITRR